MKKGLSVMALAALTVVGLGGQATAAQAPADGDGSAQDGWWPEPVRTPTAVTGVRG